MSEEQWQSFQKQQSLKLAESSMPVDSADLERRRRKQEGLECSVKSLFCCLSVLCGRPSIRVKKPSKNRRQSQRMEVLRRVAKDDDSFGYNFDDQISPRVLTRLARDGHNFD
mmetsp:Transcript_24529/g.52416  ORF Transcript_24529/g.52416 Transcript_24529/m.52416 type:complete len:112 (-) Transcript_24529:246-581(-)|eukprot:CAMPEP_0172535710 /NCGR_PEP_ID=MMETSP1067-20121228/7592_1 /TAXON_ID=265564 ORGANISM="Thalassiosira punctigera, Strain Tpunct2005C2" /NCGR_SAMPLE_ID=MMETSP1067 /ASSEMBLY_ACC=CAM_ASM_000444 /LENGTH=111 /DNA_ID=CAMNT_0013320651 /DNA_START=259 /DNA_END=594 /DNA_ORIENTATION=+